MVGIVVDPSNTDAWMTSAAVVAAGALIFTVASFWWLNARRGRLKSFEPHTFSCGMDPWKVRLRLPLVVYNTGAIPIIVQNLRLRLRFPEEPDSTQPLPWVASLSQIKPEKGEARDFPAVLSISGRAASQMFVEFGAPSLGFTLEARGYPVQVDAKLGHKKEWQSLLTFTLQAGQITCPDQYLTYENTPPSEERRQEADAALKQLAPSRGVNRTHLPVRGTL